MRTRKPCIALLIAMLSPALGFGGTISGKVTYTGTPVKQKPIDRAKEPNCAKQHNPPVTTEPVVRSAGRWVFSAELGGGKGHGPGRARRRRNPDTGRDDHWERDEGDRLHLQSESLLGVTSLRGWRRRARRQYARHLHLGAPGNPG